MIYAYWTASARDAEEGRSVFAGGDGRPASASGSRRCRCGSTPTRRYPGIECAPFQIATQSFGGLLVGVRQRRCRVDAVDWIRDGTLTNLIGTRCVGRPERDTDRGRSSTT